ncbi:MAG TPA: putative phage abortive infection protein [Terriglobales bacterium]|nr:putative phage abortive infection protein [Terriglobales bacterium]
MDESVRKASFWRVYQAELLIILVGVGCAGAIFVAKALLKIDLQAAGEIGSFVGGCVGALFALGGVALLLSTLRTQQSALQLQTSSLRLQSFESRYFELIKLHRDNVSELEVGHTAHNPGVTGRKVFVWLLREFRCLLGIVREVAEICGQSLSNEQLLQVAYYCLFFGVGANSSRMLKISLSEFDPKFVDAVEAKVNDDSTKQRIRVERKLPYMPFDGHQSRLGHYYRHLYQMISYVDQQPSDLGIDKYEYVKTMRAQLSTHEQAMLLINSRTPVGKNWWKKGLIENYYLVKNIPPKFFTESEIDLTKLFKPGYFEWED